VNFQFSSIATIPRPRRQKLARVGDAQANPRAKRRAYFSDTASCDVPVWRREDLLSGMRMQGPAIIEEKTSTIVLYPGQRAEVDEYLNIEVSA
jgi:N-methylhydantoinase A